MKDPEDSHREDREPDDEDDTDPVPAEPDRPSLWQWPVVRGVANGALFAVMLSVIQVYGLFREARPLDDESLAGNIGAGVVFGFVMYIVELWRWHRRAKPGGAGPARADRNAAAAEAARRMVERRLERDDDSEDETPRR
ncbi:hypothetical protein GCM10017083_41150 [Thalassobaculum fulvum]|uniref:Uncharacterized protein n=1 Tax=Thalassobaculum fulvum TaxID=1633335 RepID=A0A919CRL0_9PROT|nr:hypothetical protein [Thalassobaculum fulvum]GHD58337.1 hypothetical protein GCM10017083_41150 [Thalassobaculum fulvum]